MYYCSFSIIDCELLIHNEIIKNNNIMKIHIKIIRQFAISGIQEMWLKNTNQ